MAAHDSRRGPAAPKPAPHRDAALPADAAAEPAWRALLQCARAGRGAERIGDVLVRGEGGAWAPAPGLDARVEDLLELYLPICNAARERRFIVGHLGQSLDGFIATRSGDSDYVTGRGNIEHLHRMRALSSAVVVGAGTVAADDPELTTRLVEGPSPARVVLDPRRRLGEGHRLFTDGLSPTFLVCADAHVGGSDDRHGLAELIGLGLRDRRFDLGELASELERRGLRTLFVEGGGLCVSSFLEAGLLDRLQLAIAPLVTGAGRPGIAIEGGATLGDCLRPLTRVFGMGRDVLFDCDLSGAFADDELAAETLRRLY